MNAERQNLWVAALAVCMLGLISCREGREAETAGSAPPPVAAPQARQEKAPSPEHHFVPQNPGIRISRVSVPDKLVALTFDDGPHASLTPRILDILDRRGAKGTFFVLGQNAVRMPSILNRAASSGHEIASHSWSHPKLTSLNREKVASELSRTSEVIRSATGKAPALMRPPYGAVNASLLSFIYSRYGTPAILWDVDTNDWRKPGVQTVINRAVNGAKSGSIILVHDIHQSTADAIEGIVKGLQERGFRLVTVSELIAAGRRASGGSAPARTQPAAIPVSDGNENVETTAAAAQPTVTAPTQRDIRISLPENSSDTPSPSSVGTEASDASAPAYPPVLQPDAPAFDSSEERAN